MTRFNVKSKVETIIRQHQMRFKKMLAIYYSGRIEIKNYERNKGQVKQYSDKNDVVYFCSLNEGADSEEFINNFCEDFNITKDRLNIEKAIVPSDIRNSKVRVEGNLDNMYSMFYNNYKCIKMIEKYQNDNNCKFDIVMKYRTEIEGHNGIIDFKSELQDNTVYIPNGADWCDGLNDQIAYGNFDSMLKYSKCVLKFLEYGKQNRFHPETLLLRHVKNIKLNVERFGYSYKLKR